MRGWQAHQLHHNDILRTCARYAAHCQRECCSESMPHHREQQPGARDWVGAHKTVPYSVNGSTGSFSSIACESNSPATSATGRACASVHPACQPSPTDGCSCCATERCAAAPAQSVAGHGLAWHGALCEATVRTSKDARASRRPRCSALGRACARCHACCPCAFRYMARNWNGCCLHSELHRCVWSRDLQCGS